MNKQQAIDLVQKTFESAFDKTRFTKFIKELLNEADFEASFSHRGQYIYGDFEKDVSLFERIAKYSDGESEIDVLIVHLKKGLSIERARTMQRNFIAKYLNSKDRNAALVAFVSPNPEDWRFSLVKMEYAFTERPDGALKAVTEFTPAKRWSFLVGSREKSHTAQRQFQPILADSENNPTLEKLVEAFNVEKVTREFFEKYRDLFIRAKGELDKTVRANPKTKADFESKGIDTTNLAKKLLGQIIFLYFLQKKGWFGVPRDAAWGEGSRGFLRELFDKKHSDYKNFFNDILEPLFYDALRRDRSEDDHYYPNFKCKIPFLNGGLFDPMGGYDWTKTDILLPNELFSNMSLRGTKQSPDGEEIASAGKRRLAMTLEEEGDGILDVFDLYNFTVNEDEPFEKEVAIDPELLGKAYEKFNAIRPDNYAEFLKALKSGKKGDESKFNKQYGVYYTPREIVHHMCQQSLINYLATELEGKVSRDEIAVLILQGETLLEHEAHAESNPSKTYQPILSEAIRKYAALIDEKLANIKVCDPAVGSGAFLVGMMSEIVRAREVLAIYVRTDRFSIKSDGNASLSAQALESASNTVKPVRSLTTYDFKRQCIEHSLYGVDIDAGAVEIAKLRLWLSLVVDEDDIQNIKPLPNLDYKVVQGNSLIGVEKNLFNHNLFEELESLKPLYFNATNPNQKKETKKKIDGLIEQITDGHAQFDFEIYFSEVFHEKGGFDIVIGNPPYIQIKDIPEKDRRFYENCFKFATGRFNIFYLFIEISSAIAKDKLGIVSLIIPDRILLNTQCSTMREWLLNENQIIEIVSFDNQVFETAVVDSIILLFQTHHRDADYVNARTKVAPSNIPNSKITQIPISYINLSPSAQFDLNYSPSKHKLIRKILKNSVKLGSISDTKDGIIQSKIGDLLFLNKSKNSHCRKLLVGENITKFSIAYSDLWVDYRPDVMIQIERDRGGNGLRLREREIYERPKILTRQTADEIIATFDENENYYYANTLHGTSVINEAFDAKFVLGVLNSKLTTWFYRSSTDEEGKTFAQIKIELLRLLPIPNANPDSQTPIIHLVVKILSAKHVNPQADTFKLESEIDQLVYQLYGLTEEEVKIVEGR